MIDTFTALGTVSYKMKEWVSLTTGLGKGFADNDNPSSTMKLTDADWATGVAVGLQAPPLTGSFRDSFGLSAAYEYNISKKETSLSIDVTVGWVF